MWKYICGTYAQTDPFRLYEHKLDLAGLSQGDHHVHSYYKHALHLWIEYDLVNASLLSGDASVEVQKQRSRTQVMQFLMELWADFKPIRASLIH
ncbi:unnamed protein product [Linum trigynum]|uniref:Uncharacterized protein n=1 Tax=Linum trigynum TaxID=586398 RepID=A0AAV2G8C2_9ROSI